MLVIQPNEQGEYKTIYWDDLNVSGAEVFNNQGSAFVSTTNGVGDVTSPSLVISSFAPVDGAELAKNESIRIQFNDLINTNEEVIASALSLQQADGSELASNTYNITATNTLAGANIVISFTEELSYTGALNVNLSTGIQALNTYSILSPLTIDYLLVDGKRPSINAINRVIDGEEVQHFFHANGTEMVRITGENFGDNLGELKISIGETLLQNSKVTQLSNELIEFVLPDLFLANEVITLPITVERNGLSVVKQGAIVILPAISIDDIAPISGSPQGGNTVDLFGSGFNHSTEITFGGVQAGDLRVINSGHIQVRAPAGTYGYAPVAAVNSQFEYVEVVSPIDYFYAEKEKGSVDLNTDKASPVSAIFLKDQVLYAVTGGHYDVIGEKSGRIEKVLRSNVARLVVTNVADPVRPIIIEKEFANVLKPYHIDVTGGLAPEGFVGLVGEGTNLFALGGKGLYHFDITLPTSPNLLNTLELDGTARDIAIDGDLVYVSDSVGIHIYKITDQRTIRRIKTITSIELKGTTDKIYLEGNSLWASMPNSRRVIEVELMSGEYNIVRDVPINTLAGKRVRPRDLLVKNNLLFISTGNLGTVELFSLDDESGTAVASLNLAYLVRNGDLFLVN
ncbi:IPT/TIG domain-containing protein [Colwellia sp. MSW7]|uniref:IPT/TIG domain-containing protein n=1 Tax=Colwellia maritima TaxID=2912588 RepID=A0ABS9X4T3_9GAMM|nr:IPT/TIG domain-containing protein [Colwellia maritima]MCI2285229.1 IPT/TIG domain-containing protein [Colwellia maritima]